MLTLFRLATDEAGLQPDGGKLPVAAAHGSMCRLGTGRSALAHLIGRLPAGHARTVLLPCYVAEGVIKPFQMAGFDIVNYGLQSDLTPVSADVDALLTKIHAPAVVVRIHYFGFPTLCADLDAVLRSHGAIVLDDFAHSPFAVGASNEPLVEGAQLGLFSLNKFLPVTDGAILTSNRSDIDVSIDETLLDELPVAALRSAAEHLLAARDLFEANDVTAAHAALARVGDTYESLYAVINSDFEPRRQSDHSRRVERSFPLRQLIENRVCNSRILYAELSSATIVPVHRTLHADVVPFCIPARVPAGRRAEIQAKLFEQGVVLSTLQEKWDFIPVGRHADFKVESAFLEQHLLIPISEFITTAAMHDMVARLNVI